MKFKRLEIPDLILCEPKVLSDERGYFMESFRQDKLEAFLGFSINFCQENESKSSYGVLRGLHYQAAPFAQTKLVRVIEGSVLDIALDIRKGSKTFGQHLAIELSADNKKQLLIPRGFAHGFVVLSESAVFSYKVDNQYNLSSEKGIMYNDELLGIDWRLSSDEFKLSSKDIKHPLFKDAYYFNNSINLYE